MVRVGGAAGTRTICPNGGPHGGRQQAMTSLSRRLERLEAGCRQSFEIAPDRCRLIKQQALQHLTTDQLRRSEEHTSELQSLRHLVCRLLLEKKKTQTS